MVSGTATALGWVALSVVLIFTCTRSGILGALLGAVPACGAAGLIIGILARSVWVPVAATALLVALFGGWPVFGLRVLGCSTG